MSSQELLRASDDDAAMKALLADDTVDGVNSRLDAIKADRSMKKSQRRELVARVIKNQPHPTKEFAKYNKWNGELRVKPEIGDFFIGSLLGFTGLFLSIVFFGGHANDLQEASGNMPFPLVVETLLGSITGVASAVMFFVALHSLIPGVRKQDTLYGQREYLSLAAHDAEVEAEQEEAQRQQMEAKKRQLEALTAELSGEPVASLATLKQDFADAQARIASYETDMTKALKHPAFNDITVPDVQRMVAQLRTCKLMSTSLDHSNAKDFSVEVSELWVRIQTAEETAKRIALGSLSDAEVKGVEQARNLLAHATDSTYSEDVRAGFYQKLKSVVDRLNENRTLVPTKIVAEIESKAARLLTAQVNTEEEPVHV